MVDRPIQEQVDYLVEILSKNPYVVAILDGDPFPGRRDWYLGAGCVCQTVWNFLSGKEITDGIEDYDLVYYDASDLSSTELWTADLALIRRAAPASPFVRWIGDYHLS